MILTKASKISGTVVIFALLITIFIASEARAQSQYCACYSRRPVVRHVARTRVRRTYHTARVITVVRPVYKTVYVPRTQVASYVGYDNESYATGPIYESGYDIERIARGWGHRDGFKDGYKAALKFREYNAENNHDFRDADNGYKRRFGSKFLYKSAYRDGYVRGYDVGFRSVSRGETYGSIQY